MIRAISTVAALLAGSSLLAAQAPDFTLKSDQSTVVATPPIGHHFNIQAPMLLEFAATHKKLKPTKATERQITFRLSSFNEAYTVALFLCDDAKTYCEKHQVTSGGAHPNSIREPQARAQVKKGTALGFILNDPDRALAKARAEKKPLLIDFFGIWCPPCNMLDSEVFPTNEFKGAAKRFILLKLDADADVAWALKSRYKVGGYPTIIFATPDGDEISRIVGFRPARQFVAAINAAWRTRDRSLVALKTAADRGDVAAATTLGRFFLQRDEFETAEKYLEKAGAKTEDLMAARIGLAEEVGSEEKLAETLEQTIKAFPDTPQALERTVRLAELTKRKDVYESTLAQIKAILASPSKLEGHDLTPADLWGMAAEAHEALSQFDAARADYLKAAEEYRNRLEKIGAAGYRERGNNLELAYNLWKGGKTAEAEQIYARLAKAYPNEFTFHFNYARMNLAMKKLDHAQSEAKKAFEHSYGDNRLRAGLLLAQISEAQGKPKEGVDFIQQTLKTTPLPTDRALRSYRYVKKLRELEEKLAKART